MALQNDKNTILTREELFAWIMLAQHSFYQWMIETQINENLKKSINDALRNNNDYSNLIIFSIQNKFIPENNTIWIDGNIRQLKFLTIQAGSIPGPIAFNHHQNTLPPSYWAPINIPHHLLGRDRGIAIFDYIASSHPNVESIIYYSNYLNTEWTKIKKSDSIFDWINDIDFAKKIDFFSFWLSNNKQFNTPTPHSFNTHNDLLEYFDNPYFREEIKILINQNFRKAWGQRKRREEQNGKRQCNFVLSEEIIKKLEFLALKHGLTRTEVIEILIDSEKKKEIHITERLNRKSLLITPL